MRRLVLDHGLVTFSRGQFSGMVMLAGASSYFSRVFQIFLIVSSWE